MSAKFLNEDEAACNTAAKFTKLYYDAIDRKRNKMNFLYTDASTLVWNGTLVQGVDNIAKFYDDLPNTSHMISAVDCHHIDAEDESSKPIVVLCVGNVVFGQMTHAFSQTLILVTEDEKYKVVSDRFRFID